MIVKKILRCEWTLGTLFLLAVILSASDGHLFPLPNLGGLILLGGCVALSRDSAGIRQGNSRRLNPHWVSQSTGLISDQVIYSAEIDKYKKFSYKNLSRDPEDRRDQGGLGTVGQVA
jgi:hypothetical protein